MSIEVLSVWSSHPFALYLKALHQIPSSPSCFLLRSMWSAFPLSFGMDHILEHICIKKRQISFSDTLRILG